MPYGILFMESHKCDISVLKMADLKLSRSETLRLIELYKERECLWKTNSKYYKYIDIKNKSWQEIAKEFNVSADLIKKKIKYIRTAYVTEKKKHDSCKRSGIGTGEIYEPSLFYYNDMKFLNESIVLRTTSNNVQTDDSACFEAEEATEEGIFGNEESPAPIQSVESGEGGTTHRGGNEKKRKKVFRESQSVSSKYESALSTILKSVEEAPPTEEEDMFTAFAKSVSLQLKNFPLIQASEAMYEIQGVLHKHTVEILRGNDTNRNTIQVISNEIIVPSTSKGLFVSKPTQIKGRPIVSRTSTPCRYSGSGTSSSSYMVESSSLSSASNILETAMINSSILDEEANL